MVKIQNFPTDIIRSADMDFDCDLWDVNLSECAVSHPTGWKFIFFLSDNRLVAECVSMPKAYADDDMQQADITLSAMECYMAALKLRQ